MLSITKYILIFLCIQSVNSFSQSTAPILPGHEEGGEASLLLTKIMSMGMEGGLPGINLNKEDEKRLERICAKYEKKKLNAKEANLIEMYKMGMPLTPEEVDAYSRISKKRARIDYKFKKKVDKFYSTMLFKMQPKKAIKGSKSASDRIKEGRAFSSKADNKFYKKKQGKKYMKKLKMNKTVKK